MHLFSAIIILPLPFESDFGEFERTDGAKVESLNERVLKWDFSIKGYRK